MLPNPILLIGGSGIVGRWTAKFLRAWYPDVQLLIGGRDLDKSKQAATEIGNAEGVVIDLAAHNLGLGERSVSAVAVLFMDDRIAGLRFAQANGLPHISISPGIIELGPQVAAYINRPNAAPVVLGTEWLVGATTIPTLQFAREFGQVQDITISALLDDQDASGPAADLDLERQMNTMPAALARGNSGYYWRTGDEIKSEFRAVDGTLMDASAFSPFDVVALAEATGATNVQFNLALGMSSSRRSGRPMSTEIIIELAGNDHEGRPLHTRHAVVHSEGQMPLTGLGVAMLLERLTGIDGNPPSPSGLYFPYQLLEPGLYLARLKEIKGEILNLEV